MTKTINICFITDVNYITPTGVAIESLIENCDNNIQYNIFIVAVDTDEKIVERYKKLKNKYVNINIINTENIYCNINTTHPHVSKAAMLKFNLSNMFPNLDKMLYIDGDTLILGNLFNLYNIDLQHRYAAVVLDMEAMLDKKHHEKLKLKKYFNSGMMLLNLKQLREDNITKKLLDAKKHDMYQHFMDQDALNKVFNENIVMVSLKYNCMLQNLNYPMEKIAKFYNENLNDIKLMIKQPVILHLTNKKKPWNSDFAPGAVLWNMYYKKYQFKVNVFKYILENIKNFIFKQYVFPDGNHKVYIFGIKVFSYTLQLAQDSKIKRKFLFTKENCSNGRKHIFLCGIKIFSYGK